MKKKFIPFPTPSHRSSAINDLDYPTGKRPSDSFKTQQTKFALLGYSFHKTASNRSASVYVTERNGHSRIHLSLRDSESFLKELKGLQ